MNRSLTRREVLAGAAGAIGAGALAPLGVVAAAGPAGAAPPPEDAAEPFGYCLNTSTLRGHRLGIVEELEIAAKAGYGGVELWVDELDRFEGSGGKIEDLAKRIRDLGLKIPDAIAFPEWMVDDAERRAKAIEDVRRRMEQVAKVGCTHIAAPPVGNVKGVDLLAAADRYRALLELGDKTGVTPAVEVWGFAQNLFRLGQAALVAMESKHPKACIVPDVYHLHKGGSGLDGVRHLNGASIAVFHVNDYPAEPPREEMKDSHRVFPGDGAAPLKQFFRDLKATGYRGMLSLELFNAEYYKRPAADVAREGIEKTRAAVRAALA